jgi:alkanesulfonate monooxygenase SsuD/methylene tetrahydromethanopterin reductase-like flavin-dependent oxidoreductase (luciferase family)
MKRQARWPRSSAILLNGRESAPRSGFSRAAVAQTVELQWLAAGSWPAAVKTMNRIGYWVLVYVDETDEKAVMKARRYFSYCFTKVFGTRADGGIGYQRLAENFMTRNDPGAAEITKNSANLDYLLEHNLAFVGSPKTVAEQIKTAASEGLFNTVLGEFNVGDVAEEDLMRSIKLFSTEVGPGLRRFEPY